MLLSPEELEKKTQENKQMVQKVASDYKTLIDTHDNLARSIIENLEKVEGDFEKLQAAHDEINDQSKENGQMIKALLAIVFTSNIATIKMWVNSAKKSFIEREN